VTFENGYKIPKTLYDQLFDHQKTGIHWLWELHNQEAGGIVAGTDFFFRISTKWSLLLKTEILRLYSFENFENSFPFSKINNFSDEMGLKTITTILS
jgi:SNF2 family DNA or RNA helicase